MKVKIFFFLCFLLIFALVIICGCSVKSYYALPVGEWKSNDGTTDIVLEPRSEGYIMQFFLKDGSLTKGDKNSRAYEYHHLMSSTFTWKIDSNNKIWVTSNSKLGLSNTVYVPMPSKSYQFNPIIVTLTDESGRVYTLTNRQEAPK